jgi:hypothetical protein
MFKIIFGFFGFLISLFALVFWVWCIIDIVKGEFKSDTDKIVWLLLVILLPFIGSVLYVTLGRRQKVESLDEFI